MTVGMRFFIAWSEAAPLKSKSGGVVVAPGRAPVMFVNC